MSATFPDSYVGRSQQAVKEPTFNLFSANSDQIRIIKMMTVKNHHPVIVFSFIIHECHDNALIMSKSEFDSMTEE
ncbi:hypothetical protein GGU11DRAFT_802175 [Lentinula aff. detonsa]|nr:hypothetical protein GGU11DRAFT_802175 [Lentinula aff. detonsa]